MNDRDSGSQMNKKFGNKKTAEDRKKSQGRKSKVTKPRGQKANGSRKKSLGGAAQGKPRKGFAKLAYITLVGFIWFCILMVPLLLYYAHDLPDISGIGATKGRSTIMVMDRDGGMVATYGDVYGQWLDYQDIPSVAVEAVIATEDRRFFDHMGLDLRGLGRAILRNISSGKMVQGGSSITQQLAKNLFLNADKTFKRKIQELLLSFWLEMNFSKQDLLTFYFNRVYFGSGAYGLDAAARTYFGHSALRLEPMEAAMLAGMLKGPSLYSPLRDLERSYGRAEKVLQNMVDVGYLTAQEAQTARSENVNLVAKSSGGSERYFTDWVVEQLTDIMGPVHEPVIVYTTLMPKMQQMAELAVQQVMGREGEKSGADQAALLSMDVDGAVRAMVGGRDFATSQFNRVSQARRQPGSSFKTMIYLAALEAGFSPESEMRDSPVILNGWEPKNYNGKYSGSVSLREAFVRSLNTVAVKLSERINRGTVIEMARRMGITTPITPEPALALGTSETSLLELTSAYAILAGGGFNLKAYGIVEVQNSKGQILYRHMPGKPERILSPEVNETMNDMLRSVVNWGTARGARMDFPVYGKTGTTQSYKDALFVGYGMDVVNGVWVGNDDARPMKKVTGSGIPVRIWRNFMLRVATGRNDGSLQTPNVRPRDKPGDKT